MKYVPLFLLSAIAMRAAFAPDSIAGKIYRESSAPLGASGVAESTIHFITEDRYTYLSLATVSFITDSAASGKVVLRAPPSDGRYVYRKFSDTSASIEFFPDSGSQGLPRNLTFSGPNYGGMAEDPRAPRLGFSFADASALSTAPAANVSMRGRVADGRSLVIGFVVPGIPVQLETFVPPAGTPQREILIRVIGGTSLRPFGIVDGWSDPDFELFSGSTPARYTEYKYSDWSKITYDLGGFLSDPSPGVALGLKKVFTFVGAFPLADDSKDAVGLFRLAPGAYTIVAAPKASDIGGEVLVEVYFLP